MIKRLRLKFICITLAILTVMMSVLLTTQFKSTRNSLTQINMKALEDASREYLDTLPGEEKPEKPEQEKPEPEKPENEKPEREKPERESPEFNKPGAEHPCFVLSLNDQGDLEAVGSSYFDLSDQAVLQSIYQRAVDKGETTGMLWEYELRYLRADGMGKLHYVFTDISSEVETLKEMGRNTLIIWSLGFAVFLILSIFLSNWAIRPVEQAWEQQRQFVADASHELKTPLTVILTNAELLRETSETPQQRQFSDSIVTMSAQMRGLVESMLQLARADSDQTMGERERLDCSDLLEQTLLPFEPLYFEAGMTLESSIQPGIMLTGNAVQLRRVVEILLDNALKYAAPGGTVRVKLESRGCQCCLSVSSPGETLTSQQCRDIFKRFYRVDPVRRRNGSYGLGLAIAEQVVSAHRGKIWAEGRDGVNTFYVNLPLN